MCDIAKPLPSPFLPEWVTLISPEDAIPPYAG